MSPSHKSEISITVRKFKHITFLLDDAQDAYIQLLIVFGTLTEGVADHPVFLPSISGAIVRHSSPEPDISNFSYRIAYFAMTIL